jgi:hypothetical protein
MHDEDRGDVLNGAQVDALTPDGLYFYTDHERECTANWLYDLVHNQAYEIAGWLGDLLTDAADQYGNQFTNCFVNDDCSSDNDSEAWKNPGVGRAVSPDNILFWDPPTDTNGDGTVDYGAYGHSEWLVYRNGAYMAKTTWQDCGNNGTVSGRVLHLGNPVPDASVTIAGMELFTDNDGRFEDDMIPAGDYEVVASKFISGYYMSARLEIPVVSNETTYIDLELQPPSQHIRRVVISGSTYVLDWEIIDDEDLTCYFYAAPIVDPFRRDASVSIDPCCAGAEARAHLTFSVHLKADDLSVTVSAAGDLYEGADCDNWDHDGHGDWGPRDLPPDGQVSMRLRVDNTDPWESSWDYADFAFEISNEEESFPPSRASTDNALERNKSRDGLPRPLDSIIGARPAVEQRSP